MKRLILAIAILCAPCWAQNGQVQVGNYGIQYQTAAPAASCTNNSPLVQVMGTGSIYTCQNGSYTQISSGGSGTLTNFSVDCSGISALTCSVANPTSAPALTLSSSLFVVNNAANTAATGMTLDLSAATGASAFKVPVIAGATAGSNGVIDYDSTAGNTHLRTNAADSIAVAEVSALAANTIPKATDATHGLVTGSGLSDNATTLTYSGTGIAFSGAGTLSSTGTLNISPSGTNAAIFPIGTATNPSIQLVGMGSTTGLFGNTTNFGFSSAGTGVAGWVGAGATVGSGKAFCASSTTVFTGAADACLTRVGPLVWAVGTLTQGDETGYIRAANVCRITADITLSTSATNICLFSNLPAVAKSWYLSCSILWSVTAGTTPTLSLGVNASQTPTGSTNISGAILTTNTSTGTEATAAVAASGAINIITSPTLTTAATIFTGSMSGTLLASATAGTFAVTATGTGASFAGVIRNGTGCELR